MKQATFGSVAGVCLLLCAASNTHADTVGASSISDAELTRNEMTSVFFDADSQPHTPSNPTTSTLIVPVAVGPLFNADRQDESASNSSHDTVPVDPPMPAIDGGSNTGLVLAALGLIPQPQESGPSVPTSSNPLPPAFVLFGTALVGLSVLARRRLKRLSA